MKIDERKPGSVDPQLLQELLAQQGNGVVPGADLAEEIKEIVPLLRNDNSLIVTNTPKTNTVGTVRNATGLHWIDDPDCRDENFDLERLIAMLEIDSKKDAGKASEESIKTYLAKIQMDHSAQLKNLKLSLDIAEQLAKIQRRMAVFGWIMAAIMVVVAVASAVFSGGTTLGLIGAGIALASAAIGIGQQAAQSSGRIEKDAKAYAEKKLKQNPKLSYNDLVNEYKTTVSTALSITNGVLAIAGLACGVGALVGARIAAKAMEKAVQEAVKQALKALENSGTKLTEQLIAEVTAEVTKGMTKNSIGWLAKLNDFVSQKGVQRLGLGINLGGSVSNVALGGANTGFQFKDASLQSELAKWQKNMKEIEKTIESTEEKTEEESKNLKAILQAIQDEVGAFIEQLGSKTDTTNKILERIEISA